MAGKYSYSGIQDTLGRLGSIAGFSNSSAWVPGFSPSDAYQHRTAMWMLPYATQIEQARMQARGAEEAEKRRYRYQYGI